MSPAKKRRAYGSGAVTQRKDGYWIGRYEAGYTPTGARRRRTVTAKTEAEAKRRLLEAVRKQATEDTSQDADARTTVKTWSDKWLDMQARKRRPKSVQANTGNVRNWIVPTIGHKRLTALTPADIRAIGNAVLAAGLSTSTAHQAQSTAVTMLRAARREGHSIPERVVALQKEGGVELMPMAEGDRDTIPTPDAIALLVAASAHPQEAARWGLAMLAGLRPGEACGLRWADVDLDQQTVTVEWQRQELTYLDKNDKSRGFRVPTNHESRHLTGTHHLVRPKNKRGYRVVPLVDDVAAALRAWQKIAPDNPWGLVFTDTDTRAGRIGRPLVRSKKLDAKHWLEIQDAAQVAHVEDNTGRRYAVYELRHTTATLLWMLGTPPPVIEQIVGHSAAISRKYYAHTNLDDARRALAPVGDLLRLPAIEG